MEFVLFTALFILVFWLPQNIIHEGAHAIVGRLYGLQIIEFWPFPSTRLGRFTFAYVRYAQPPKDFSMSKAAKVCIAPIATNVVLVLVLLILMMLLETRVIGSAVLSALILNNSIDCINNCKKAFYLSDVNLMSSLSDLCRWGKSSEATPLETRLTGIILVLVVTIASVTGIYSVLT